MTGAMIMTIIFLIVGFLTLPAVTGINRGAAKSSNTFHLPRKVTVVPFVLALLFFLVSILTIVPTREIGVVTSFGKPVGNLPNGLHLKAPWEKVHMLDGTIQTDNHVGSDGCTDIRIGNESTACVDNTIRWRIKLDSGERLYQDYREMENIRDSLVTRELKAALNEVLSDYNPLDQISKDGSGAPDLNKFSDQVTADLTNRVGDDVEIKSVILPIIRFDKQTQSKINAYQAEVANTRIAEQRTQTATAQSRANEALRKSVSKEPNVLVAQCLDTLAEMVKEKQQVPIGFSCWPGGSGSTVVLPKS
jgi:regulator of protease activity HflC (stomatin/prohibitin superfamily)